MKKIYWDEGLSIGDPELDGEHRQFISLLNRLIDLIDESPDLEQVHRILDELEQLAIDHGRHEESLFSPNARGSRQQQGEHEDFRLAIIEARNQLRHDDLGSSLIDMTESLVNLLINHIIDQDLDLAPLLAEREVKNHSLAEYLVLKFQKISFVRGLEMLVVISLLPMLVFAGMIMYQSWRAAAGAGDVARLAAFSQRVGGLVHELQKERGLSAGFLTSDDRAFQTALKLQRRHSDRELDHYRSGLQAHKLDGRLLNIGDLATRVLVRLEVLAHHREQIDRRLVTPGESFDGFTGLITELIGLTNQIAIYSRHHRASELFQANALMIQYAEMGGRERAVVAAGFGRGKFTREEYRRLVSLTSEQGTLERQFRSFLSEPQWLRWRTHYAAEAVIAYQRLSDYALESGSGDGRVSVDSFTWFKVATQRINLINSFQRQLIGELQEEMKRQRSLATAIFMTTVFGGGAMVLLIGFVAVQLARSIRLPILSLTEGMRALTAGDKSLRIPFAKRRDELGDMVQTYETFRRKLIRTDMLSLGDHLGPLAVSRHVLELKRSAAEGEEYKRLASIDSLTGVLNRREFMKRAKMEVARLLRHPGELALMLLDVDYFKQVNDNYGHPAGDRVLKFVAQAVVAALREEDILGRIGGEEFAVLLPATDRVAAGATAERVRTAIENLRIQVGEEEIKVTMSLGISEIGTGEQSIEPVMLRADRALYQAKDQGRNRVCSQPVTEALTG